MNFFPFLIFIFLWEIMSVDRKEALNIVAGLFAWQRVIILDITVAGARGGQADHSNENIDDPEAKNIKNQNIQEQNKGLSHQLGKLSMNNCAVSCCH